MDRYFQTAKAYAEPLRPYFLHLAALACVFVLGLVVAGVKVAGDPPAVDAADRWPFPKWEPYRAGPQRQALASLQVWTPDPTKAKASEEKKVAGPPWRFIGTLQDGKARIALIELDQGKRIQRIASGQPLPNGGLIKKIDVNELTYDDGGTDRVLRLFGIAKTDSMAAANGKN